MSGVVSYRYSVMQESGDAAFQDVPMEKIVRSLFSRHGSMWARQSIRSQQMLEQRANIHICTRRAELKEEYLALEAERQLILDRVDAVAEEGVGPLCMSAAALSEQDLMVWGDIRASRDFCSDSRLKMSRQLLCVPPLPKTPPALPDGSDPWKRYEPVMPDWAKVLAKDRDFFIGTVLVVPLPDGGKQFFKIVYIVQVPLYVALCPLVPVDDFVRTAHTPDTPVQIINEDFVVCAFRCNYARCQAAADLPPVELNQLRFIRNLRHDGGTLVTSAWSEEPVYLAV